ncbi:MAG: AGE family epimerase/isomerase [Treponema sp.]|nr:AGE family epimerase/isomerase [Treponema sp.]
MNKLPPKTQAAINEIKEILTGKLIPFWLDRGIDNEFGGYLTCIGESGEKLADDNKYIVTQARMIWGFSALREFAAPSDAARLENAARQGFDFFIKNFWDAEFGGFFWKTNRAGKCLDAGKLSYGQSFAIYALSEYGLRYGSTEACSLAKETFDAMQVNAADTLYGGYFENMQMDWSLAPSGIFAGDRKSLDIHMHLMEAFTVLYRATGLEIHRRKLLEVIDLILLRMVNEGGYGFNQFDRAFNKIPAINIYRTWNAERETNEKIENPADTTSYGHNVELSWLMYAAYQALGISVPDDRALIFKRLLDHSIKHGYDNENGGIYRDGIADGPVLVTDKEWWQNFEAMAGYLNGFLRFGDEIYCEYFGKTWDFIKKHFLIEPFFESRQLLDRKGNPIISNIGNPWKGIYHTGRAMAECIKISGGELL